MTVAVPVVAYEHFDAGQDATQPGTCTSLGDGTVLQLSVGPAVWVEDPALATLAPPFLVR